MPVYAHQAVAPRRLSAHCLVLCGGCFIATLFGTSAIAFSVSLILNTHAGSTAYWLSAAVLFALWLATLINLFRRTVQSGLLGR